MSSCILEVISVQCHEVRGRKDGLGDLDTESTFELGAQLTDNVGKDAYFIGRRETS